MAISAGMIWDVRSGGDDTNNGGGFRGGSALTTPSAPTCTPAAGGAVTAGTYYCVVTLTDADGETQKSGQTSVTTSGGNLTFVVTSPTNPGGYGQAWNLYVGTVSGGPYFQQSTGNVLGTNKTVSTTPPTTGTQAPGVDYSQSTTPQVTINNTTITATTTGANSNTLTFTAGYVPTSADVGNTAQMTAGTNINAGVYEITGWSSTTWTLSGAQNLTTASGAGSAIVGKMGGSFATPGKAASVHVNGNDVYIKATTYSCSASANVAGGKISTAVTARWIGWDTTRSGNNLDGTRPVLQASANSMDILTLSGNINTLAANLVMDANGHTAVNGLTLSGVGMTARNCKATGCVKGILVSGNYGALFFCEATACTTLQISVSNGGSCYWCWAHDSSGTADGFQVVNGAQGTSHVGCVASNISSHIGFNLAGYASVANCTAYNCGTGFSNGASDKTFAVNCVASTCSIGMTTGNAVKASTWVNCAGYNNTTDLTPGDAAGVIGFIHCSSDPFVAVGSNNFALNNTSGGGALLRAASYPSVIPGSSTSTYGDIGAAQTSLGQPGAGGAMHLAGRGGGLVG